MTHSYEESYSDFQPLKSAASWLEARKLTATSLGTPEHERWRQTVAVWNLGLVSCFACDAACKSVQCLQVGLSKALCLLSGYPWVLRYLLAKCTVIGGHVAEIEAACSGLRFAAAGSFGWYLCRSWR